MTRKKRWTAEEAALLLQMKADRRPRKDMARHFGVSARSVDGAAERFANPGRLPAQPGRPRPAPILAPLTAKQAWQRNGERWSEQENAELIARADKGEEFHDIGITLNRTRWACKVQYHSLKRGTATEPTKKTTRQQATEAAREIRNSPAFHATLTSAFFGDPLPGRSALDRLRAGIADPPAPPDHRTAHRPQPKVTLATEPMR